MGKRQVVRRLVPAVALWLAFASAAAAQATLDLLQFRDRVAAEIRRELPEAKVVLLGQVGLRVVLPGETPKDQSMAAAYDIYRQEPARLTELVQAYARSFRPIPVTAAGLRVLVRTEGSNPPPEGEGGDRGLTRPIAGGLIAIVAMDGPDAFEFPRGSRLRARLKMDDAAIWTRALANTRAQIPFEPRPLKSGEPVSLESGKDLSSSLLVDDTFWNSSVMLAQGPVVVALAGRDEIYLAPLRDTAIVAAYRNALAEAAREGSVLFPQLLVRRDGRWHVLP